jgi:diacylglycerol kinase family enzyme
MRFSVVLNCAAGTLLRGTPQAGVAAVREAFSAAGLSPTIVCADGRSVEGAVRDAARVSDVVVVGGGDGTLRSAAAILAGSRAALGVLPLGTFNHFAKELRVPFDLGEAAKALAAGTIEKIDLGSVNDRVFINHAAVGIYPHMVRRREALRKGQGLGKFPAMAIAFFDTFVEYPTFGLRVRVGGAAAERRSPFAFVANNRYILDSYGIDGHAGRKKLSLLLAHDAGRWALVRMGLKALAGRLGREAYDLITFEEASIAARRKHLLVELDGELERLRPPLHFRLLKEALGVLRPGGEDVGEGSGGLESLERPPQRAVG